MIDYSDDIFTAVKTALKASYPNCHLTTESSEDITVYPTVSIEEITNVDVKKLLTNVTVPKHAQIQYRVQVLSAKTSGKRKEARAIYGVVADLLKTYNFVSMSFTIRPKIYRNNVYQITSVFRATIDSDGRIYRG